MYNKLLLTLSIFIFIACGGGTPQEAQVVNIGSLGAEMKYDVEEFTVKACLLYTSDLPTKVTV